MLKVLFKQEGTCWTANWWIGIVCTCDWVPVSTSECGRAQVRPCVAHGASLYGCKSRIVWQGISCLVFNRPVRLSLRFWMSKQSVLDRIYTDQCKETTVIFNDWRINNWDDWAELRLYQALANRQVKLAFWRCQFDCPVPTTCQADCHNEILSNLLTAVFEHLTALICCLGTIWMSFARCVSWCLELLVLTPSLSVLKCDRS